MKFIKSFFILILLFFSKINYSQENSLLSKMLPDVVRQQKTERTYIFSRAQFIYSLGNNDYLHKWVDRPLFINTLLDANKASNELMSLPAYEEMQKMVLSYGLDGFAFFPQTSGRSIFYDYTKKSSVRNFQLLTEFLDQNSVDDEARVIQMALNTPQAYKIDEKIVITSYNADLQNFSTWKNNLELLRNQFPDKFIFLPSITNFGEKPISYWQNKFHSNTITLSDINRIKDYLRKWAQLTDGLYFSNIASLHDENRNFDVNFYNEFIIRIMKSVLAEPEFKDKYFGLSACVGHENVTRFGYTLNSNGTKTLRESMEAALAAKPDIINIPEWDEQNENTSLRPTVYNGLSSMRIMRFYTAKNKNIGITPIADDNFNLPDLIVSYRRIITLGEKLQIELLNVPDNSEKNDFSAKLILKDLEGNIVYTSPSLSFIKNKLQDETITLPSESFFNNKVLIPSIEVKVEENVIQLNDGLQYIELRPTWNWNYKWVKQSVRDILHPSKVDFTLISNSPQDTEIKIATASIKTDEQLAQLEVLNDDDDIYNYSQNNEGIKNQDSINLILSIQSFGKMEKGLKLKGNISVNRTSGNWLITRNISYAPFLTHQSLSFDNARASVWKQIIKLSFPRSQISSAILSVNLPGIYNGNIPVKQIIDKGIIGIPGPNGFNLVISQDFRQIKIPPNLDTKQAQFSILVKPEIPTSLYQLQAISKSGKIYRSKPIFATLLDATKKTGIIVYSDTKEKPISLTVNKNEVPDIIYQFDPDHGSVLFTNAGSPFRGILGGYFAQATGYGGGNAGDDIPFIGMKGYPQNINKTAPNWVKLNSGYALQFDGKGTFISLPQGVIPIRSNYSIDMDIYPESSNGKQIILANRSIYIGSIILFIDNGILKASYSGKNESKNNMNSGLSLPINQWSHLKVKYDQNDLFIWVNDKEGNIFAIKGPGLYETATVIGGYGTEWFQGQIKSLIIKHGD